MGKSDISPLFNLSPQAALLFDEPLAPVTSFKIGGPAELLLLPAEVEDVRNALQYARDNGLPWHIIGSGTNLLVPDEGLSGLTIKFWKHFDNIEVAGKRITAQAGADMLTVAMRAGEKGLSGLEWGSGIPGTIGGAVFMNAGVKGAEIKDSLSSAVILEEDGSIREYCNDELSFSYRFSILQETKGTVLTASFDLEPEDVDTVFIAMNEHLELRKNSQPINLPNCGSVFRNPAGDYAGRLIQAAGLKGFSVGGVMVSEQHANFIVNIGGGTAADVLALIKHIKETVKKQFGIELKLEMRIII